ncbi:MAG: histidinol dehydrogenase [Desulfobacterota bacterium]|nr:histidinol dehydrogenase [Thermodesulfobacteriota bacterium]MDW8001675.1 histidinol dehydrogenase [Deltaproteobacteria bacterium]
MKIWELEKDKDELVALLNEVRFKRKEEVRKEVLEIKKRVEKEKERALIELSKRFDGWDREYSLKLTVEEIRDSLRKVKEEDILLLKRMAQRVRAYHEDKKNDRRLFRRKGLLVEEDYVAIEKLLIYAPGGKASYPSSLIMAAVPALIAGVKEIYVTSPAPKGEVNPYLCAAAEVLGITNVYRVGGAQAIFAFALGLGEIPKVDMIVGPGNAYVEEAKRECFGLVGLDTIAGPSELLILVKEPVFPDLVAKDMLSQAEHDEMALVWLLCRDRRYIEEVISHLSSYSQRAQRKDIIEKVLERNAFFVHYASEERAIETINRIAPEHLEVIGDVNVEKILYPGIIYLGITTPTALGDYYIGTNHILPTGGSGRFLGGLSVETFKRKRVMVKCDLDFILKHGKHAERLAEIEGLECHKEAIRARKERRDEIKDWVSKREPSRTDPKTL